MPGMPYHLEKGGWLSVLEDYLNGVPGRSAEVLRQLRDPNIKVSDTGFLQSPSLNKDPDYETVEKRVRHLRQEWFGYGGDPVMPADPQAPFLTQVGERVAAQPAGADIWKAITRRGLPAECDWQAVLDLLDELAPQVTGLRNWPITGFWVQYYGDVEEIVRQTLIRTIEVSLGLDHGEDIPAGGPRRQLPIELFWKCPQRWFEGWVTWRWDESHGHGQVTSMFATPGSGKPVLQNPLDGLDAFEPSTSTTRELLPAPIGPAPSVGRRDWRGAPKGMWVVTHQYHLEMPDLPDHYPTGKGDWAIPEFGPTYVGLCDVVCVQPSEADGGTKPFGRGYLPPPADADGVVLQATAGGALADTFATSSAGTRPIVRKAAPKKAAPKKAATKKAAARAATKKAAARAATKKAGAKKQAARTRGAKR